MLAYRNRARPARNSKPREYVAIGPNQVWSWVQLVLLFASLGYLYYCCKALRVNAMRIEVMLRVYEALIDSKTYITGWTGNQGNKRKLKNFAVSNAKKYKQSYHSRKKL